MNYNEFNEETKSFMNKAMDIYSTIKEEDINRMVRKVIIPENHQFTKLDKKVLSLFIAGFMVDGNLKEILREYDDIKLNDLLSFIGIRRERKIKKLKDDKYSDFYSKNFKLDIEDILKGIPRDRKINYITPEVIVSCLQYGNLSVTNILDYFWQTYDIESIFFSEHPAFNALENYTLTNGSVSKIVLPKENNIGISSSLFDFSIGRKNILKPKEHPKEQLNKKKLTTINLNDESIWLLLDEIKKKFIGQEVATEGLFYNIVNNQQLAEMEEFSDGQRSIIFLDGPTGTGKTAITREITEKLGIPFVSTSMTKYSATGYVGANITDILKELHKKANGDIERAQRGIVVLDEFDKIAYSRSGGLEMKRAVQQQLLDFLGGGKYTIPGGNGTFDMNEAEFDTSKLTFVCLGALTDLRSQKTEKKQSIGFRQSSLQNEQQDYTITPQDLMEIGLEKELVGRFNTYLHTNDYSRENLINIFKESTISPLISFRQWIESRSKKLEVDEDVYDIIADQAYELNTGARSLQTVMNNIRTTFIKEVLRGTSQIIHLDSETVIKVGRQTTNRKGRS